ncbi:hypothetical protein Ddc_13905 [Ditylenchus destructor]|nr:hypothetical protein Ddc_13905 [Ditylenchus destructor]
MERNAATDSLPRNFYKQQSKRGIGARVLHTHLTLGLLDSRVMDTCMILFVILSCLINFVAMCPGFECDDFKPKEPFGSFHTGTYWPMPDPNMENCKKYNQYEKCVKDNTDWLDGDCDHKKNFAYRAECDRLGFRSNSPSSPLTAVYIVAIFNIIVLYSFL